MSIFGIYTDLDTVLIKHLCPNGLRYLYQVNKYYYKLLRQRLDKMMNLSDNYLSNRSFIRFKQWINRMLNPDINELPRDILIRGKKYIQETNSYNQTSKSIVDVLIHIGYHNYEYYAGFIMTKMCDYEMIIATKYDIQNICILYRAFNTYQLNNIRLNRLNANVTFHDIIRQIIKTLGLNWKHYFWRNNDDFFDIYWNNMFREKLIY